MNATHIEVIKALIVENLGETGLLTGRVWIATLLALIPMVTDIAADDVPAILIQGHLARHWHLTRCDLVGAAPAGVVDASELHYLNAEFHFARI